MGKMDANLLERIGNLHLVILHLPIGLVVAAVLVELWCWRESSAERRWLLARLLGANAVAALLAAGAGLVLASQGTYAAETLMWHRWAGVICAGLAVAAWLVRLGPRLWLARVVLVLLVAATVVAGHFGATLTHGRAVTSWWPEEPVASGVVVKSPESEAAHTTSEPMAESVFITQIQPLLVESCVDCHGPKKAKGGLRLDSREAALAEGKSGLPGIVPGKPEASELLSRVKLPADDDDVMPAKGEHLTPAQIAALERWIADGAVWR